MRRPTLVSFVLALVAVAGAQAYPQSARERHEYDLIDVDWYVQLDPAEGSIQGTVVNTVTAAKDGAMLVFDAARMTIESVEVDAKPTPFGHNGKVLTVETAAKKGQTLKVKIRYNARPEAGLYFVPAERAFPAKTPVVYTQGEMEDNRYWLPTYDSPDDKATSRGQVSVPIDWSVLSNGRSLPTVNANGSKIVGWALDKPHSTYLISFVAGPYTEIPDGTNPVLTSIWTPPGLEGWGKNAFGGTDAIIRFYGSLTGTPYPWPKYAQSAVPQFMFGGMENVSATTQTIHALFPDEVKGTRESVSLNAHELAHQWFGDWVTTPRWDDVWINEGWASFLPHFWFREKEGQESYDLQRYDTLESAKAAMYEDPERAMVWNGWTVPMQMFDGYAYAGGAARMFALMHGVGEKNFWTATKNYLAEYGGKNVDTEGFFRSFGKSLGADLSTFERQWFRTPTAPPRIEVRREGDRLVLKQTQKTPFTLYLDVWALTPENGWIKKKVPMRTAETTITLAGGPVLVDAEAYFPLDVDYKDLSKADRLRLWQNAPNAASKMRLVGSLMSILTRDEMNTLIAGASARLQARLVQYSTSTEALLSMTLSTNERLAQAALNRLREVPATDAATARLRAVWLDAKANPDLRLAALKSLYALTKDPELLKSAWMETDFESEIRLWTFDMMAKDTPESARDTAYLAFQLKVTEPIRLAAIRVLGRLKDAPGERKVYELLVGLVEKERSIPALRAAVAALGEYGDKAAIPVLETKRDHSLHFVRGDVAAALARLGKG